MVTVNDMVLALLDPNDTDQQQALIYLTMSADGATMQAIADKLGISRQWLYVKVKQWESEGTLDKLHTEVLSQIIGEHRFVVEDVLRDWPLIVKRVKRLALSSKSELVGLQAADWLFQNIIKPAQDTNPDSAQKELRYVQSDQTFDPQSILDDDVEIIVEKRSTRVISQRS